jgi:hypothetical protein
MYYILSFISEIVDDPMLYEAITTLLLSPLSSPPINSCSRELVSTSAKLTGFLEYQQLDYRNSSVYREIKYS